MENNNNFSYLNYRTMDTEELEKIHELSLRILQEIGGVVKHDEALSLLCEAGAKIEGQKVLIPEVLVNKALESVPREYTVYDRQGSPAMVLKERCVYYGPGSDTTTYVDFKTDERRKWTKKDIENGIILCDSLEHVDFVMSLGIISDVDIKMNTREQYATMIRNTVKPQVVVCDDSEDLKDVIAMAAAVRGGLGNLREKPLFSVYCEPSSPLVNSYTAMDKLLTCAENSIPTNYAAGGMAGGTTPSTAEGTILLNNAECLLGLVIHQLKNQGAPFLYGFGNAPLDMKTMQSVYAAPVAIQIQGGMCDLSRYYRLPSWGEAGCSSSKICDEQSALEAAQFILMAALQGCNVTHDLGYLNFGLSVSFEHLSVCNEIIGRTKATLKKLNFDDYLEAYEAIKRVGHGGNYIGDEHTYKNMRASWFGDLSDYRHYDNWKSDGELAMRSRAHLEVQNIIGNHKPEPLDAETDRKIDVILKEAKSKL